MPCQPPVKSKPKHSKQFNFIIIQDHLSSQIKHLINNFNCVILCGIVLHYNRTLCTRPIFLIQDQYIKKQDGVHLSGIQTQSIWNPDKSVFQIPSRSFRWLLLSLSCPWSNWVTKSGHWILVYISCLLRYKFLSSLQENRFIQ